MSASREKKNRRELNTSGYVDPKAQEAAEKAAKEKRTGKLYTGCIIAFLVIAVALFVWDSNLIQRGATAYTVDGQNISAAEMSYYYGGTYQNFYSQYSAYVSYFFDTSVSLRKQQYTEDQTWFDYFASQAEQTLTQEIRLVKAAEAAGYSDDEYVDAQEEYQVALMSTYAKSNNMSLKELLKNYYGELMTEKVFRSCVRRSALASSYQSSQYNSYEYTDAELQSAYDADPKQYDMVDIEYVVVDATYADDATDEEKTSALELARKMADHVIELLDDGETMEEAANTVEGTYYHYGYSSYGSASDVLEWAFDDARKDGDTAVIEKGENGYYAVQFNGRFRPDESPVSVRHILVADEETANDVLAQFNESEKTEADFATLAMTNSTDSGSATSGGLYSDFYYGQMVEPFETWSFDSARQSGDTGIVQTDYGYHVMYFVERNALPYWKVCAENDLRSDAYNEWFDGITAGDAGVEGSGMKYVG